MGASSSKAARAAGSAARQYPNRPSPPTSQTSATQQPQPPPSQAPPSNTAAGPTVHPPQPHASGQRSAEINLDASDPDFARSLRSLGPVQPNPTMSPTSAFDPASSKTPTAPDPRTNPALAVLDARARLQSEAEREALEVGKRGFEGRRFLDVYTIRQMLVMRDERGAEAGSIERALGLREGSVRVLGPKGAVGLVQEVGRAQKGVDIV